MAIDDAILDAVIAGDAPPTLRLYGWDPACLSLGHGQPTTDADLERIAAHGWEVVRRPTGGRAILHTDELTYSVALPADHPIAAGDIVESYRRISRALMAALVALGAQPQSERRQGTKGPVGPVCFEVPSHYEITIEGRKLIGSAQVRRKSGVLQHGTLPLYGDVARICDALSYPDDAARDAAREQVHTRATTLTEALGRRIEWSAAADAVMMGFREVFDLTFREDGLSAGEAARADELAQTRYATIERYRERT